MISERWSQNDEGVWIKGLKKQTKVEDHSNQDHGFQKHNINTLNEDIERTDREIQVKKQNNKFTYPYIHTSTPCLMRNGW